MRIRRIKANHRKKAFEVATANGRRLDYPYSRLRLKPAADDRIAEVRVDPEVGGEGFTYTLASGKQDTGVRDGG